MSPSTFLSSQGDAVLSVYPVPNPAVDDVLDINFGFNIQSNPGQFLDTMVGFRGTVDSNAQLTPITPPYGSKYAG
jgi:hypothetical protein